MWSKRKAQPYFDIEVNPFRVTVKVLFSKDIDTGLKEWDKNFNPKLNITDSYKDTDGMVVKTYDDEGLICWGMILPYNMSLKVLVHESFHLLMNIADEKQGSWDKGSDEFYAYSLENVFQDIYNFWTKNIKDKFE